MSNEEEATQVNADEYARTIADIREWLVKIDTNQQHQTKLLETLTQQSENAFQKADLAEDKADEALKLAQRTEQRLDDKEKDEKVNRRWLVGTIITIVLFLLPIIGSYYGISN